MVYGFVLEKLRRVSIEKLLYTFGMMGVILSFVHLFVHPYGNNFSVFSHENNLGLVSLPDVGKTFSNNSKSTNSSYLHGQNRSDKTISLNDTKPTNIELEMERDLSHGSIVEKVKHDHANKSATADKFKFTGKAAIELKHDSIERKGGLDVDVSVENGLTDTSMIHDNPIDFDSQFKFNDSSSSYDDGSYSFNDENAIASMPALRKRGGKTLSITELNALLLEVSPEVKLSRKKWSSARDRELQNAKFQIENAPIQRTVSELHASLFRNYSIFKRSYELMESRLKVYIYREGEKPFFHLPYLRGIYASEGWFMKLMERSKQFVVKDPKKAHLFYLPFSLLRLRTELRGSGFGGQRDIENHLNNFIDVISTKYRFWNRTGGEDHFFAACHDWAPRATRKIFGASIRAMCNSNIASGFKIGKDVSLPVTYIRSSENPAKDLGGNPPSNRTTLAFFAGGMHGYVRPILLQHWHNKEPDMKIFGPMPRDLEAKARYRDFMKSSKYCICAKGYEVHTPRVVESIYYECVPVIISDNYVPPFFEILNWEAFAVFILERDIPNLRNTLLSIPEDRYLAMQRRVKAIQPYFLWHKTPQRYDLFHMILHSVWHNRLYQLIYR